MASSFYKCFRARLDDMGMPAPETIFGTLGAATATVTATAKAVATYGTEVTLAELLGAGIISGSVAAGIAEVAGFVGSLTASFYVGVCLGAISICTSEALGNALSMTKVKHNFYKRIKMELPEDMVAIMTENPEMRGAKKNSTFGSRSRDYGYGNFSSSGDSNLAYA